MSTFNEISDVWRAQAMHNGASDQRLGLAPKEDEFFSQIVSGPKKV
jgi:hypothetical protein